MGESMAVGEERINPHPFSYRNSTLQFARFPLQMQILALSRLIAIRECRDRLSQRRLDAIIAYGTFRTQSQSTAIVEGGLARG